MAVTYLRSTDGDDADDGSTWALADAFIVAGIAAAGAGGTLYVSQAHAESSAAALAIASSGTIASPTKVIGANDAAEPPTAVSTAPSVTTTGANAISFTGSGQVYGLTFNAGTGAVNAGINIAVATGVNASWVFDTCNFNCLATSATNQLTIGGSRAASVVMRDCTIRFSNVNNQIKLDAVRFDMYGGSIAAAGSVPTTLFTIANAGRTAVARLLGVDLSAFGAGKTLVDASPSTPQSYLFHECKLGASVSVITGTIAAPGACVVDLVNCDSGDPDTNGARYEHYEYAGSVVSDISVFRTGGATDGVKPFSRKMVSLAGSSFLEPLPGPWVYFWNTTIGAVTAAIEIVTDNVTLTDAEAWIQVEDLATSGFPKSTLESDRAADILATPANQATSSESWTTGAIGTPVKQVLSKAVTVAEIGWIRARVRLAKASTTLYFCPKISSTSPKQYMAPDGSIVNECLNAISIPSVSASMQTNWGVAGY